MGDLDFKGIGRILLMVATAFFVKVITGVGPALPPPQEDGDSGDEESSKDSSLDAVLPVTIRWSNITCYLSDKRGKTLKFLLTNVGGEAKPGRLLAIMGPSGSGKTTLLNVLAGQLAASPRLHLSGHLDVNGEARSQDGFKLAYVRQEDLFFSQLTVRETLTLAAELQLPNLASVKKRDERRLMHYHMEILEKVDIIVTPTTGGFACGDQDSVIPLTGSRTLVKKLAKELGLNSIVPYRVWFEGKQIGGWTQVHGDMLTFATIRGASHEAPFSQPTRSLGLFRAFLANRPLHEAF